ncbi:MAG: ABC transporter ATP-binding protein [Pseudonocardia sp.]|nr:ABC transporter ATP-binding protein [Pseudonocardia sp.]
MAPLLVGTGLTKRYGSLTVLDGVDFTVSDGEAVGIVGPNGAGKTTLLGVLSGSIPATGGRVELRGDDLTAARPEVRCRRGIGRAHQVPRPFGGMTVLENVVVGASAGGGLDAAGSYDRAVDVLEVCGLVELANRRAESLGLLHRKRLELARSLATGPRVLLLDEIGGGLTDAEALQLVDTILSLRERGVAVVWIEHIVHVLLKVVDRLICMDAGVIIADGPPHDVLADAVVIDAYLGRAAS